MLQMLKYTADQAGGSEIPTIDEILMNVRNYNNPRPKCPQLILHS